MPAYNPDNPAGCAHNTMISSDSPTTNFNSSMSWPLPVGTTSTGADRGLIQFPLGAIPSGSAIDSAAAAANGSSYRYDQDTTAGDTFTFVPQLTEAGTYQVQDHYVASSRRRLPRRSR